MKYAVFLFVFLAGCVAPLGSSVDFETSDIVSSRILTTNASFFGVSLNMSLSEVTEVLGMPETSTQHAFGSITNYEYVDENNETFLLVHFVDGFVQGILVTQYAQTTYPNLIGGSRSDMYMILGLPTRFDDLSTRETVYVYDEFGYEIFVRRGEVSRMYFTTPNRGILPKGVASSGNDSLVLGNNNSAPYFVFE